MVQVQTPLTTTALESRQVRHWLKLRPEQEEQEKWQPKQFPLASKLNPLLQTQVLPDKAELALQERHTLGSEELHVAQRTLQPIQFPFMSR